jgi:hypothetical protein
VLTEDRHAVRRYLLTGPQVITQAEQVRVIGEVTGRLNADYQMHAVEVGDPLVRGDKLAVRFAFDQTHLPTGRRRTAVKVSLYTVADAAIVREEVCYLTPPHAPA